MRQPAMSELRIKLGTPVNSQIHIIFSEPRMPLSAAPFGILGGAPSQRDNRVMLVSSTGCRVRHPLNLARSALPRQRVRSLGFFVDASFTSDHDLCLQRSVCDVGRERKYPQMLVPCRDNYTEPRTTRAARFTSSALMRRKRQTHPASLGRMDSACSIAATLLRTRTWR